MADAARVNSMFVGGSEERKVPEGRQISNLSLPPSAVCRTVPTSARQLRDGERRPAPAAKGYASNRLSCAPSVPAERASLNSSNVHRHARCTKRNSQQVRNEVSVGPAHLQAVSFPLLLPLSVTGHGNRVGGGGHTFHATLSAAECLPNNLPGAISNSLGAARAGSLTSTAPYIVRPAGPQHRQPIASRVGCSSGIPAAPARQPASTRRAVVTADVHKSLSLTSTTRAHTSTSGDSISSSSADGNLCVIKECEPHDSGLAVRNNDNWGKTHHGDPGALGCQAGGHSTSSKPTCGSCAQHVEYSVQQHTVPSRFWRISPSHVLLTNPFAGCRSASTVISESSRRKTATYRLRGMSHPTHFPQEVEKLKLDELPKLLWSAQEQPTLPSQRPAKPDEILEPCIADIRAPPVQRGNVLFCSYCRKRLVRQKNYMPCWPEFLLCDTCALLPRCSVCHRKALPAYISLKHNLSDPEDSKQMNPSKSRNLNRAAGNHSETSSSITEECSGRHTGRIRCEPLHDAEGLQLCGHCALLNPVKTKEGLLRLTQYALLWLQERHGLVFTEERLAVQRNPLVQERVQESLLRHDRLHRSASTPEVLLLHALQRNDETDNLLIKYTNVKRHDSKLEIECNPPVADYPLRIESTESVRSAQRQTRRESSQSASAAGEAASTALKATDVTRKVKDDVRMMHILTQSIQQLCHSEHAAKQCLTENDVLPTAQQQYLGSYQHQRYEATTGENNHGEHSHVQHLPTQQQIHEIKEAKQHQQSRFSDGNLGFAIEAVGYTKLNVGEKSNVFGRCETERLLYDDLLLGLPTQGERIEQRRALDQAVQVSRGDAIAAATAASGRSVAMQRSCSKAQQTPKQPELLSSTEKLEYSLNCIRRVAVLRCLPETVFLSHLVHELVHAYIWCAQPTKERTMLLQIEEGICNAVTASFLHDRLEKLALWEGQLIGAGPSGKRGEHGAPQQDSAFRGNAKGTTTREASAPTTSQGEPPKLQTDLGVLPAATERKASPGCLTAATEEAAAMDARAGTLMLRQTIEESEMEADVGKEERKELLLLLIRYEARVLRTRLNEMETDEHYCYGKGYRVMRRIMQDIQLQQILHVATHYGSSLEAVEQAAASLLTHETNNANTNTSGLPVKMCTTSTSSSLCIKCDTSHVLEALQGNMPSHTTSPCQQAGRLWYTAVTPARNRSSCEANAVGDVKQQLQSQRQILHPTRLHDASARAVWRVRQQGQPVEQQRHSDQMEGLLMPTRKTGQGSVSFPEANLQCRGAQPRSTGSEPTRTVAVTSTTGTSGSELLDAVCSLFWQKKPGAEKHDALQNPATGCRFVAQKEREREHTVTATASN